MSTSSPVTPPPPPKGAAPPQSTPPKPPVPPVPPRPTPPPPPPPPPAVGSRAPLLLGILGFLLLAGVAAWQWTELQELRRQLAAQAEGAIDPARLDALETQLHASQQQVAALAQKPPAEAAPPVDLAPLEARLAALEQRPAPPPPDDSAVRGQMQDLSGQLSTLGQKLEAAQSQAAQADTKAAKADARAAQAGDTAAQAGDKAAQAGDKAAQADDKAAKAQAQADQSIAQASKAQAQASQSIEQATKAAAQSSERAARAERLEAASLALSGGKPIGALTGAPAALTQFATAAPPTEASLRLSFEAAAKAAEAASDPAAGDPDLADRMWQRVQSLVVVRRGDHVLVGAPASVVLAESRQHLIAGDLAGAVGTLDRLDPSAAKAMASWRADAQSLLDARAALASLVTTGQSAGNTATP